MAIPTQPPPDNKSSKPKRVLEDDGVALPGLPPLEEIQSKMTPEPEYKTTEASGIVKADPSPKKEVRRRVVSDKGATGKNEQYQKDEEETPEGWTRHPKTGKLYKQIPKTQTDSEGNPVLHLTDLDLDDLTGEADKYLAHLRI